MTAQASDGILYKSEMYDIVGVKGKGLVSPGTFGMIAESVMSCCWRGFVATYEIIDDELRLHKFSLTAKDGRYLPINGIMPKFDVYENLQLPVSFTGKLRIAKDFIEEYYVHMGFQHPTAYKTVLDLSLKKGEVVSVLDRSAEMEPMRGEFKKRFESDGTIDAIYEAFSLRFDL